MRGLEHLARCREEGLSTIRLLEQRQARLDDALEVHARMPRSLHRVEPDAPLEHGTPVDHHIPEGESGSGKPYLVVRTTELRRTELRLRLPSGAEVVIAAG